MAHRAARFTDQASTKSSLLSNNKHFLADLCGGDCHRRSQCSAPSGPAWSGRARGQGLWGVGHRVWGTAVPWGQPSSLCSLAAGSLHSLVKLFNISASGSRLAVVQCHPHVQPGSNLGDGSPPGRMEPLVLPSPLGRTLTSAKKRNLFPEPADQLFL